MIGTIISGYSNHILLAGETGWLNSQMLAHQDTHTHVYTRRNTHTHSAFKDRAIQIKVQHALATKDRSVLKQTAITTRARPEHDKDVKASAHRSEEIIAPCIFSRFGMSSI